MKEELLQGLLFLILLYYMICKVQVKLLLLIIITLRFYPATTLLAYSIGEAIAFILVVADSFRLLMFRLDVYIYSLLCHT